MYTKNIELLKPYLTRCYAPYSKFNVACMLVFNDKNYFGVNVENCSYSLTTCAEKNCITNVITDNVDIKKALYMIIITDSADTITPCGACRQILKEFFDEYFIIYTVGKNNKVNTYSLGELLPCSFTK
jgi:cytidine deaminase